MGAEKRGALPAAWSLTFDGIPVGLTLKYKGHRAIGIGRK